MTFLFRAILVTGTLTYFALQREGHAPSVAGLVPARPVSATDLARGWAAVPPETRERITHEAAAELGRRIAAIQPSQDTLAASDRLPAWKGAGGR